MRRARATGRADTVRALLRNLVFGALVGAVAMLLALPASRPFFLGVLLPSSLDGELAETAAAAHGERLPDVGTPGGRAMWFDVAASRIERGRFVSAQEISTVERLMAEGSRLDPQNAFWLQADASMLARMGQAERAENAWIEASQRLRWNDGQNDYLSASVAGRRNLPAYAYAELYDLRSTCPTRAILDLARSLLASTWSRPDVGDRLRLATLLNGTLIRQHARSVASMRLGTQIIESAVEPPTSASMPSKHTLLVARTKLVTELAKANLGYDERAIQRIFDDADAENALTPLDTDVTQTMATEAAEAALLHTVPGSCLLCVLIGGALLGARRLVRKVATGVAARPWVWAGSAAVVCVVAALFLTSAYAAFALGLCVLFAGLTPAHVRKRRPTWLGPLFWVTTSAVATVLLLDGAVGLTLHATPTQVLLVPLLPAAFDGYAAVFGVGALAVGFVLLCAPLWAFAQRLPTVYVLDVGLGQLGQKLLLGSLLLAVATGPTCVYLDKLLVEHRLDQQFRNEPLYYYLSSSASRSPDHDTDSRP